MFILIFDILEPAQFGKTALIILRLLLLRWFMLIEIEDKFTYIFGFDWTGCPVPRAGLFLWMLSEEHGFIYDYEGLINFIIFLSMHYIIIDPRSKYKLMQFINFKEVINVWAGNWDQSMARNIHSVSFLVLFSRLIFQRAEIFGWSILLLQESPLLRLRLAGRWVLQEVPQGQLPHG